MSGIPPQRSADSNRSGQEQDESNRPRTAFHPVHHWRIENGFHFSPWTGNVDAESLLREVLNLDHASDGRPSHMRFDDREAPSGRGAETVDPNPGSPESRSGPRRQGANSDAEGAGATRRQSNTAPPQRLRSMMYYFSLPHPHAHKASDSAIRKLKHPKIEELPADEKHCTICYETMTKYEGEEQTSGNDSNVTNEGTSAGTPHETGASSSVPDDAAVGAPPTRSATEPNTSPAAGAEISHMAGSGITGIQVVSSGPGTPVDRTDALGAILSSENPSAVAPTPIVEQPDVSEQPDVIDAERTNEAIQPAVNETNVPGGISSTLQPPAGGFSGDTSSDTTSSSSHTSASSGADEELDTADHSPLAMPCKHVFCTSCLLAWLKTATSCPLCREPIEVPEMSRHGGVSYIAQFPIYVDVLERPLSQDRPPSNGQRSASGRDEAGTGARTGATLNGIPPFPEVPRPPNPLAGLYNRGRSSSIGQRHFNGEGRQGPRRHTGAGGAGQDVGVGEVPMDNSFMEEAAPETLAFFEYLSEFLDSMNTILTRPGGEEHSNSAADGEDQRNSNTEPSSVFFNAFFRRMRELLETNSNSPLSHSSSDDENREPGSPQSEEHEVSGDSEMADAETREGGEQQRREGPTRRSRGRQHPYRGANRQNRANEGN